MAVVNLGGLSVTESSYRKARGIVENKAGGGRKSAGDVLSSLRSMMPGWNISTSSANWGEGFRNIEIDVNTLNRMARDPEAMVRYKALILDLEGVVPSLEEWAAQNPDAEKSFEFGITMALDGMVTAVAMMRTLLGAETRTTFELPSDRASWAELITQKLNALNEGRAENVSWQA
ncbi:MAG: DUF6033 family protein [Clostridiales bacterium]|nr:DUF6033 family protein [Clostridiales bacterium]